MSNKLEHKKLYVGGIEFNVYIDPALGERAGEGEAIHGMDGESSWEEKLLNISQANDSTLSHELGHILARARGVYMSEYQIQLFEELFTVLRDPRNAWLLDYYEGTNES